MLEKITETQKYYKLSKIKYCKVIVNKLLRFQVLYIFMIFAPQLPLNSSGTGTLDSVANASS